MPARHDIRWMAPAPLWNRWLENSESDRFEKPVRFHFTQDAYVEELGRQFRKGAEDVMKGILTDAVWKEQDLPRGVEPDEPGRPPKLYQPMQGRYYTVSASLVCRRRGLPDRSVQAVEDENASIVLRRLVPTSDEEVEPEKSDTYEEYGWVDGHWRKLANPKAVDEVADKEANEENANGENATKEKRYPMFLKSYEPAEPLEQGPKKRYVWNALIPTTEREDFLSAEIRGTDGTESTGPSGSSGPDSNSVGQRSVDPRLVELRREVLDVLDRLRTELEDEESDLGADEVSSRLAFVLLDLWTFLESHVEPAANWVERTSSGAVPGDEEEKLLSVLHDSPMPISQLGPSWLEAVRKAKNKVSELTQGKVDALLSPADLEKDSGTLDTDLVKEAAQKLASKGDPKDTPVYKAAAKALAKLSSTDVSEGEQPSPGRNENAVFRARCVYERPRCDPYFEPVVSAPTKAFRLAGVMDMKAPAREHQFAMPDAAGPEDFRDSPKAASVIIGKKLSQQVDRVKEVTMSDLNEKEIPDKQAGVAMVCRLSIPIITICALILLLVMVTVLNFIFQWLPYFMVCLPLSGQSD